METKKKMSLLAKSLLIISLFSLAIPWSIPPASADSNHPVNRLILGRFAADSMVTGNYNNWKFYGDAVAENAPYTYFENSSGLFIGVQSAKSNVWAGYYGVTPNSPVLLFHAVLTLPYKTIPSGSFDTGLYVQTAAKLVNYVSCTAGVNSQGYYWQVVSAKGDTNGAKSFSVLYFQWWWPSAPLTRDCTIVTNGSNVLKVYLDGTLVYSSSTLDLQMRFPFNAYLEVQSTHADHMLYGGFRDYYATFADFVTVLNVPPSGTVQIVDASGDVLATTKSGASNGGSYLSPLGFAILNVGVYHFPMTGQIRVLDRHSNVVSSSGTVSIWGGDVYLASDR